MVVEKKIKDYINTQEQKVISFEEIEVESLLIKDILDESNYEKKINQSLSKKIKKIDTWILYFF